MKKLLHCAIHDSWKFEIEIKIQERLNLSERLKSDDKYFLLTVSSCEVERLVVGPVDLEEPGPDGQLVQRGPLVHEAPEAGVERVAVAADHDHGGLHCLLRRPVLLVRVQQRSLLPMALQLGGDVGAGAVQREHGVADLLGVHVELGKEGKLQDNNSRRTG